MAVNKRHPLIFDKNFIRIVERSRIAGSRLLARELGEPAIMNQEFCEVHIGPGNILQFKASWRAEDPFYPVIDVEARAVVGVLILRPRIWVVYHREKDLSGRKVELGRYLTFVKSWSVVRKAFLFHVGLPPVYLLCQN